MIKRGVYLSENSIVEMVLTLECNRSAMQLRIMIDSEVWLPKVKERQRKSCRKVTRRAPWFCRLF